MFKTEHKPVLLKEAVQLLNIQKDCLYIDCNFGGGGHSIEIINRGGIVIGLDIDTQAITNAEEKHKQLIQDKKLFILKLNFRDIDLAKKMANLESKSISGVLYDLGLSTFQLKEENKGFSFEDNSILDMRMDESLNVKAVDLLKVLNVKELAELLKVYGEDPQSLHYAKTIKAFTAKKENFTAFELAEVIRKASFYGYSKNHPATRVFQALRIAVNDEMNNLEISLNKVVNLIDSKSRISIITFHSLEDKLAKNLITNPLLKNLTDKPLTPTDAEILENNASRSAKLRAYEKL